MKICQSTTIRTIVSAKFIFDEFVMAIEKKETKKLHFEVEKLEYETGRDASLPSYRMTCIFF